MEYAEYAAPNMKMGGGEIYYEEIDCEQGAVNIPYSGLPRGVVYGV